MTGSELGLIGGIAGGVIGTLGGAIGTYFSIKNTNGPKERRFMVKISVYTWLGIILFLAGLFALPKPYNQLMWVPYSFALVFGIKYCNKTQQKIRETERSV